MTWTMESPYHPGIFLKEDFLEPLNLTPTALAKHLNVPANRITRLVRGETAITADTATMLEKAFGFSAGSWMALQARYDLAVVKANKKQYDHIKPLAAA